MRRKNKIWQTVIAFIVSASLLVSSPITAEAIFGDEEGVEDYAGTYGWDVSELTGDEWDLTYSSDAVGSSFANAHPSMFGENGVFNTTLKRSSAYGLDYYEDLYTTTKKYLGLKEASGGNAIVQVALSQVGLEDSVESPPNSNQVKYVDWYYGYHASAAWCDIFVTWCANECGFLEGGYYDEETSEELPLFSKVNGAGCGATYRWFTGERGFDAYPVKTSYPYNPNGYVPVPGDLMLFYSPVHNWYSHIGIVVEVTESAVYVVEGNNHYGGIPGGGVVKMEYTYNYLYGYPDAYCAEFIHVIYPNVGGAIGVYNFLAKEFQLTDAAVAGIMLSMDNEVGIQPDRLERGFAQGFGLWGATDSDYYHFYNWGAMRKWCIANGYSWITYEGQLQYLKYEVESRYQNMLSKLQAIPNTEDGLRNAAMIWAVDHQGGGTYISASGYGSLMYQRAIRYGAWPETKTWAENYEPGRSDHELSELGIWNGQLFNGDEDWSGQGHFYSPVGGWR